MLKYVVVIFVIFFSCGTGEPISGLTHHIFRNETEYKIEVESFFDDIYSDSFSLKPKEEYIYMDNPS